MGRLEISKEEKKAAQALTFRVMIGITAIIVIYLIYALATKRMNIFFFQILLGAFVVMYFLMSEIVEPYRLGMLKDMTIGQKSGFMKMMVADIVGVGALLYWIVGMGTDKENDILFPVLIYILCTQFRRKFRPEFEGTEEEADGSAEEQFEDIK